MKKCLINIDQINQLLIEENYSSLAEELHSAFVLQIIDGVPVPYEASIQVFSALQHIITTIIDKQIEHENLILELFRSLRNYVINPEIKSHVINDHFLNISHILHKFGGKNPTILKVILQFLVNLVVSSKTCAGKVHDLLFPSLCSLLKEQKQVNEVCAVLYNISLHQKLNFTLDLHECVINLYEENQQFEYLHFLLETIILYDSFWTSFKVLNIRKRLLILDLVREKQIQSTGIKLSDTTVQLLINLFIESQNVIFQTALSQENNLEPYEVSKLLEIISSISVDTNLHKLNCAKDLLIHASVVLINFHNVGKAKNCFSPIQNLSDLREPNSEIQAHPAFGFKAELIRIIANLSWRNKIIQDLAREAEVIPVILDSCNIDARNPLITQWAILAIRNLCEDNIKNQEFIAGLHQQGVVNSSTLEEFGITLENNKNQSIKIVPLDCLNKSKDFSTE